MGIHLWKAHLWIATFMLDLVLRASRGIPHSNVNVFVLDLVSALLAMFFGSWRAHGTLMHVDATL